MEFQFVVCKPNFRPFGIDREEIRKTKFIKKIRAPISKEQMMKNFNNQHGAVVQETQQIDQMLRDIQTLKKINVRQSILEKRKTQPSYMQFLTVKSQRGESTAQQISINNFGTKKSSQLGMSQKMMSTERPLDIKCYFENPKSTIYEPIQIILDSQKANTRKNSAFRYITGQQDEISDDELQQIELKLPLMSKNSMSLKQLKLPGQKLETKRRVTVTKIQQLIRNQSQQSSPTLPSFISQENHKTPIQRIGNRDSITIQALGKQDSDKLEKQSRNSTPREDYRSRDKIGANALTNRLSTNSYNQNDLTTTQSQHPVVKESLIEKSKFGIERFKAWELGLDEKKFVAGSGLIDHKNLSINQKLSKKWDVKGELQKKRQEEEDKHDINFSAKIQLGIQYKEEKFKQQMEAIGGYTIKKQIPKLDSIEKTKLEISKKSETDL
eukprot:403357001